MKKCLLILLLIFYKNLCFSQVIPRDIVDRISNSEFIFEGKVIRSNSYFTQDLKMIYTSSTIDIYKIFKGNLICGELEVITKGGCVGDKCLEISHNLTLRPGMLGVFLCSSTNLELPLIDYFPETNAVKLDFPYDLQGYIKYFDDDFNHQIVDYQYSLDSLAQVYNLIDLSTQLHYIDCHGISPFADHDNFKLTRHAHNKHDYDIEEYVKAINLRTNSTATFDTSIVFTLMNPLISGASPKYFEFDLGLSDNQNAVYFANAFPQFSYDTLTFFPQIKNAGKITLLNNLLLSDPNTYKTVTATDLFRDVITLNIINKNPPPVGFSLVDLPSVATPAVHVKMEINNCSHSSYIVQYIASVPYMPKYSLTQNSSVPLLSYDSIGSTSNILISGCGPVQILSINPDVVAGGIGDTVTITGINFGSSQNPGKIFLKDANNGGQNYINLDSNDIKLWTDTKIKFVMPGVVDSLQQATNIAVGVPGTGPMIIQTANQDTAIGFIKVRFALLSDVVNFLGVEDKYPATPMVLANINRQGIKFSFDTSFTNHSERMMVFKKAMKDWICLADMHFEAGDTIIDPLHSPDGSDTISMVEFGHLPYGTLAQTFLYSSSLNPCGRLYWKPDIIFNDSFASSFWCDTSTCDSLPVGRNDMYGIALHELGHAHGITHQNDPTKILYYANINNPVSVTLPENRQIFLLEDTPADSAAHQVMNHALDPNLLSCVRSLMGGNVNSIVPIHYTDCGRGHRTISCYWIGIEELEKSFGEISLSPNPSNSAIKLAFQVRLEEPLLLNLFDITGRQMNSTPMVCPKGENEIIFDISRFNNGVYLVKFISHIASGSVMFIKN